MDTGNSKSGANNSNYTGQRTSFPIFMLSFAMVFDFIKAALAIFPPTIVVAMVMSLMSDTIVIIWTATMSGLKGITDIKASKRVMKSIIIRITASSAANMIPLAQIFPWTTWAVYGIWKDVNGK